MALSPGYSAVAGFLRPSRWRPQQARWTQRAERIERQSAVEADPMDNPLLMRAVAWAKRAR